MIHILEIDQQIFLWLNGINHQLVDPFMQAFSGQYVWTLMYLSIAGAICWRYGWRRGVVIIAVTLAAIGCADALCSQVIRPVVARLRPSNPDSPISALVHIVDGYRGGAFGFPSCHATNTFALAVASTMQLRSRPYAIFIFAWAAMQCYSRIYLGVHYPGDLIVGALIGSTLAYGAMCLALPLLSTSQDRAQTQSAKYTIPIYICAGLTLTGLLIYTFV